MSPRRPRLPRRLRTLRRQLRRARRQANAARKRYASHLDALPLYAPLSVMLGRTLDRSTDKAIRLADAYAVAVARWRDA